MVKYFVYTASRKKQVLFACLSLVILISLTYILTDKEKEQEVLSYALANKIIVVDAGHGGKDPGAKRGEYVEKDITLAVSKKLAEYLSQAGAMVIMLREDDHDLAGDSENSLAKRKREDLNQRVKIANESDADLYISIHANADPSPKWSGAQTFYNSNSDRSKVLAVCIQEELIRVLGNTNRKAKPGSYYILNETNMPSVIVEIGFISNSREAAQLADSEYQSELAFIILSGIAQSEVRDFDKEMQEYPGY